MSLKTITTVVLASALINGGAFAADIEQRRISFTSQGEQLVGTLYVPNGVNKQNPAAGVIVTGAWTTVEEQMPRTYARALAKRGYVTLTFDFRNWGKSGGSQRGLEDPTKKTADIRAAAQYLASVPEVRHDRLAGLGVCASAGYMAAAVADDKHLRSAALVAPWLHDAQIVKDVYGGSDGVENLLAISDKAARKTRETGEQQIVPAASRSDKRAIMFDVPYYTETSRGMIAAWPNEFNLASWRPWLTFDALAVADRLSKPTLIVHSDAAAIPQGARAFLKRLKADKREVWIPGATQFDFYDRKDSVSKAADEVAAHFAKTLR